MEYQDDSIMNLEKTYHEMYKQFAEIYSLLNITKDHIVIIAPDSYEVGEPIDNLYRDVLETIDKVAGVMYNVERLESKAKELQL